MGNFSKDALKTGAKKATKFISLVALATSLAFVGPTKANASINPGNIIGEEQTTEDRTYVKQNDAQEINNFFTGVDYLGNPNVTRETIAKAIILSEQLNYYNNYDTYNYSNTCKDEVLCLDINNMYDEYIADEEYGYQVFSDRNIENKPAIDAYLNFSCGSLSNILKSDVERKICDALFQEGFDITNAPKIRVKGDKIYAFSRVNGFVQMIELHGEDINILLDYIHTLTQRYHECINNIGGYSSEYPDSFAYNGIDITTGKSAWLSLGDDELKDILNNALVYERNLEFGLNVSIGGDRFFVWEDEDLEVMRHFGFSEEDIANAIKLDAYLELPHNLVY